MNKLNIDMPKDLEIKDQINYIVEKGVKKKESFYSHIRNMYKSIGFKNLFHDLSELIFIGLLCIAILTILVISVWNNMYLKEESIYAFIFIISPLFYLITSVFSFINMRENNTYEIEMVCKYNVYQISSLRMLVFSSIATLINMVIILIIHSKIEIIKGFMISITSLFLFSIIFLYSMTKIKKIRMKYMVIFVWVILNIVLSVLDINKYNNILSNIPMSVYIIVSIGCICLYVKKIRYLLQYRNYIQE